MSREQVEHEDWPLIGPHDPPPYTVLNADGTAKVLLVADHASNAIPEAMRKLGLDDRVLGEHVAYDIGTRRLVAHLARHLDAPAVVAGYSRLLVDLNRSLADPTAFVAESDGILVPGNQDLSPADKSRRVKSFYTPYRRAIEQMLGRFRERRIVPAFISIHSFTPSLAGVTRPWHISLLWDKDPRIPIPLLARLRDHPDGFHVGDNEPYSGKHPADYTIDHHAEATGLPHVSIEVRQDLINSEGGAERWAMVLHGALLEVLADQHLYRLWET